jgi:alkylation response protein AidB-like acyl-CoA dehydrogenase
VDLALTEGQELLRRTAREFLARECPCTLVRAMEQDETGYPPALWRQLAEVGWLGLPFPTEYGGEGGSLIDLLLVCEELGRALAPLPYQSTVVRVGLAILLAGTPAQRERYLPPIVRGELLATLAQREPGVGYEPRYIGLRAERTEIGYRLGGTKLMVPWAHLADEILVIARTGEPGPNGDGGLTLFLVAANTPGLSLAPIPTIAENKTFELTFDGVEVPFDRIVGPVDEGWSALQPAYQRAILCTCAEIAGAAAAAHEMSLEYAKQRVAFGRPIGAFQAIQHKLVRMQADLDGTWLATYYAGWRLDEGEPADYEVAVAKAQASAAIREIGFQGHEIHAGIGFMREYDLQLYYRRGKELELEFGDTRFHRAAIARALARGAARFP